MEKITINMLSKATSVDGQGVGSAYLEQVSLVKEGASDLFDVRINNREKSDIIHVHTVNLGYYFRMKKNKKGINVAYCHFIPETLDGSIKIPKFSFNIFKKYVISFYKRADYLVVVNPIFIEPLVKYGIKKENIKYIPNYVSKTEFFKQDDEKIALTKAKYGIDKEKFVVIGVGQVQTRKGVKDFVEVAKMCPDIQFLWCGGFSFGKITDGYKELKEIYDNPPANVKFVGIIPRTEMNDFYNMSDCLFMPSYNELFPMSILEAINSKKPLLLRNLDLYKNILFEKYIIGNNNTEFALELTKLKDNSDYYKKYSDYAYEISNYYSKESVLAMWREFYQDIVKKHNEE